MIKRKTTFYVNKITPMEFCGRQVIWEMDLEGTFELPFEIEPTEGEHDFNKCENCQQYLKDLREAFTIKYEGNDKNLAFPLCCQHHSHLAKLKDFDRAAFHNVPEMVSRKIVYTKQHILNNHNSENWYKIITDYIEWAVESFGKMPKDCGEPLYLSNYFLNVTALIEKNIEMPVEKKRKIIEFINAFQTPSKNIKTDLNILLTTYQKWLAIFPFELNTYFGKLKHYFENQLPILNGEPEVNIYSGIAKG
jgi:hypothetical protein